MDGWISIHRKITEHPDYLAEPFTRMGAWIDLLILASHREHDIRVRGIRYTKKRGDVAMSHEKLALRWQWSRGKVKRFLDNLQKDGQIAQQKSNVINCITICNYNIYQYNSTATSTADNASNKATDDTANRTANDTADNTPKRSSKNQQTAHQTDTNNNDNKYNNIHTHNEYIGLEINAHARAHEGVPAEEAYRAKRILKWVEETYPEVQHMEQPFTEQQVLWLVRKYDDDDIRRVVAQIVNKGKTANKSAYTTFVSFAGVDILMKEKRTLQQTEEAKEREKELTRRAVIRNNIAFNREYAAGIASGAIEPLPEQ